MYQTLPRSNKGSHLFFLTHFIIKIPELTITLHCPCLKNLGLAYKFSKIALTTVPYLSEA